MNDQRAELEWRKGGVPVSTRFDDPYFSLDDGLAETRHVFLAGNDLPARFEDGFHIAELGFGTGLNLLTSVHAFLESGADGTLHYTSFEAFPMTQDEVARALEPFTELRHIAEPLINAWSDQSFTCGGGKWHAEIEIGDARTMINNMYRKADAWFLDGFSPAKNPELWDPILLAEVGRHTTQGGTFATYTAAGYVRRALQDAGFEVRRVPGFGRKRHMSVGTKL